MSEYIKVELGSIAETRKIYEPLEYYSPRIYPTLSRYQTTDRLFDSHIGVYYHSTVDKKEIPVTENDTYITVNRQTENRLDVIANIVYGFSPYWWIIAMANDIIDPFDVPCGTVLRCPPLVSLYSDGSVLS